MVLAVKETGRKTVKQQFVLFFLCNHSQDAYYAIHMRKHYGKAVERNRAKRVFRAALLQLKEFIRGVNIIIIPRKGGKGLGTNEMVPLLKACFIEVGLPKQT